MSLALDFSNVFEWAAQSIEVWEREPTVDERGVSEGTEVDDSRRSVLAMITTETDFRNRAMNEGEHMVGTIDLHILPPDIFYTKELDGKQTYLTFGGYTFKVIDKVPVNATHLSYRAERFNDPGNDRY